MSAPIRVKMGFLTVRVFSDLSHKTVLPVTNLLSTRVLHCSATNHASVSKNKKTGGTTKANRLLEKMMARGAGRKR